MTSRFNKLEKSKMVNVSVSQLSMIFILATVKVYLFTFIDIETGCKLCKKEMRRIVVKKEVQGYNEDDLKGKKEASKDKSNTYNGLVAQEKVNRQLL